jgi:hypothetical protein
LPANSQGHNKNQSNYCETIAKLRRNGRACRPFLTGALRPRRAHPRGVSAHDAAVSCHAGDAGIVSTIQQPNSMLRVWLFLWIFNTLTKLSP